MFLGILWGLSLQNKLNWNDNMTIEIRQKKQYQTKDVQKMKNLKKLHLIIFNSMV